MARFILNEKQQACLKTLVEGLSQEENTASMLKLAAHFRDGTEWDNVLAITGENPKAEPYGIFITLHLGPTEEGYIKMIVWRRGMHEFHITLYGNQSPDFSLHRFCEGEMWEALECLFGELEAKDPPILEGQPEAE